MGRRATTLLSTLLGLLTAGLLVPSATAAAEAEADVRHEIRNLDLGNCLDHDREGKAYTKACTQDMENVYQRWRLLPQSNGEHQLQGVATGRCLHHRGTGLIGTTPCDARDQHQRWRLRKGAGAWVHYIEDVSTGRCLVQWRANLDLLNIGDCVSAPYKRWEIVKR
ncbi:Ricin-type beta-trefoil lectin domain-containing protein [Streptoalloteichus tenebrarius]|uniref:Ricin-type beta-trefoil lectin domain-containing protein n=1 Tax=Streptoalloteichus tenebrarius (strain ATCC 17920 / DSM 40477 / JCM 4838 / CBS 697.72 / NBRC 16177 / NCIMB 11028 / NRRL B-12390 / A12253. 1 / ISP 5477) TaxID=1933 RepID=A0ABT1HMC5_STRSD|nr:RICIN domain-containing protein [Streptoalloteichus tenebrarius]MCP2256645.1 Ricin-type beta-trefoil lectin domain-containing protein [Streptoalloteichus tenebrarius]BFF04998.1 hypothetical protein GCM10020241_66730 [Streptoalloteichus tenebrarius]